MAPARRWIVLSALDAQRDGLAGDGLEGDRHRRHDRGAEAGADQEERDTREAHRRCRADEQIRDGAEQGEPDSDGNDDARAELGR